MTPDPHSILREDARLLETLQRLLAIPAPELRPALTEASNLVREALEADKVDVFLLERETASLVAMGTSETELGERQYALGMNRQPLANGGPPIVVFETGEPYLTGRADEDPSQLRGMVTGLGVRSEIDVLLVAAGERRGVIQATAVRPDAFTERDVRFLAAVANWIGMVTHRSEYVEHAVDEARQAGLQEAAANVARLSRRQREIAVLIAEGLTNAEIGERLALVEGTVANHTERILRKLGLRSRTQVGVWAAQHGLYRLGDEAGEPREEPEHGGS
jgi:DNA-binding CsgD family transcriptional regulator